MTEATTTLTRAAHPPGSFPVDPEHGFLPHFSDAFLKHYAEHTTYIHAVADVLTHRFKQVLIGAGKADSSSNFAVRGSVPARDSLSALIEQLSRAGVENPVLVLLQEAVGAKDPGCFAASVETHLGSSVFATWLYMVERGQFSEALQLVSPAGDA